MRKICEENEENTYAEGDNEDADKTTIMMRKIMRKRMKRVRVKSQQDNDAFSKRARADSNAAPGNFIVSY